MTAASFGLHRPCLKTVAGPPLSKSKERPPEPRPRGVFPKARGVLATVRKDKRHTHFNLYSNDLWRYW